MTSKLVVNTIESDTGISSVSFASSISMSSTSKFFFSAAGIDIGADTNINRPAAGVLGFNVNGTEKVRIDTNGHIHGVGVVTATHFYGDGSNLTGISAGTSLSGSTNNTVCTVTGANAIQGEANLTFDGTQLSVIGSATPPVYIGGANPGIKFEDTNASGTPLSYIYASDGQISIRADDGDETASSHIDFRVDGNEKVRIDGSGRLLVNTTSTSISSSELFEVKSTSTGFSHFRNNSSTYAPIYIDNEASNGGATLVPIITITDGGGNRAGLLLNNNSQFDISGQGSVTFSTGGTVGNATERLNITNTGIIQTGSKTITGGNNLAIQNFAVKGVWSGASSIGKSIELISGYDSSVKMAAVGYNLTDVNTGSTYGGDLTFHTQPLYSSPTTPLPVRMRISSIGHVTKPDTPCFIVRHQNAEVYSGGSYIDGPWTVTLNRGSHFNTSNGIFTTPVAGLYQLNMMMNNDYNSSSRPGNFKIYVNNSLYAGMQFDPLDSHGGWFTHTLCGTLNLSRNDTVRLYTGNAARVDNYNWNHWSMYLVG